MPWVSPDTTSIYGLYQQDFAFNETWSQVSVVVVQNPDDECVGLSVNERFDSEIHMYPNPTNRICKIESQSLIESIEVYTVTGKLINTSRVNSKAYKLDIQNQAKGIYFIKMNIGDKSLWKKILKD